MVVATTRSRLRRRRGVSRSGEARPVVVCRRCGHGRVGRIWSWWMATSRWGFALGR